MTSTTNISFIIAFACLTFANAAVIGKNITTNVKNKGVCTLEVPTLDLIHEDERHGVIPQGNGSRPGYSTIKICCSGYKLMEHSAFHCVPDCGDLCENGNCTAPSVCICKKGYIKDKEGRCVPTCPIGCVNGVCNLSKTCSCNSGHTLDPSGQMCLPVCHGGCGIGGECVAPAVCQCKPGFEKSKRGICEFHCDHGCDGGDCIGPNKCSCRPGYVEEKGVCQAQCASGCKNGDCVGPNRCACKPGWTLDKTGTICTPHCDEPCLNGECTGSNECTCKTGYIRDMFKASRCVAHCPGGCENGVCSGPNFCICNHGFVKQSKTSNNCVRRDRRSLMHYELIPPQY